MNSQATELTVRFEIYSDGTFWYARGVGVDIFTQGKTPAALMKNIREAIDIHFEDAASPL